MLYFKDIPDSIEFCEGISLDVIPVRIIVPWFYENKDVVSCRLEGF